VQAGRGSREQLLCRSQAAGLAQGGDRSFDLGV
jgi:hypothetical protein